MADEDQLQEHLRKLDIPKGTGTDGMHPPGLRDLAVGIARPLSIIFDGSR